MATEVTIYATSYLIFCWSLILINCCSFLLNSAMLTIFWKFASRLLRHGANRILFSLVLSDILVSLFGALLGLFLLTGQSQMLYKIAGTLPLFGSMFVSKGSLALLTADRLVSIKRPFQYGHRSYLRIMTRVLILLWLIPVLVTGLHVIVYLYTSSNFELKIRSGAMVVFFIAVATVLTASNAYLISSFKKQNRVLSEKGTNTRNRGKQNSSKSSQELTGSQPNLVTWPHGGNCDFKDTRLQVPMGQPAAVKNRQLNTLELQSMSVSKYQIAPSKSNGSRIASDNDVQMHALASRRSEDRILKTCIAVVIIFVLCWVPLCTYRLAYLIGRTLALPWFRRLALCLAASNSLLNPWMYILIRRDFRKMLKNTFCSRNYLNLAIL